MQWNATLEGWDPRQGGGSVYADPSNEDGVTAIDPEQRGAYPRPDFSADVGDEMPTWSYGTLAPGESQTIVQEHHVNNNSQALWFLADFIADNDCTTPPPRPVPALSSFGMAALLGLVLGSGLWALRSFLPSLEAV